MRIGVFRQGLLGRAALISLQLLVGAAAVGCSSSIESAEQEQLTSAKGSLKRVIISDPEGGITGYEFFLESDVGRWLELAVDEVPEAAINAEVELEGEFLADGKFRVDRVDVVSPSTDGTSLSQQPLIAPTPKRIAVLLMNFRNDTSQPVDTARARDLVFTGSTSSNAYFKEMSFGLRSLIGKNSAEGDVYGYYTLNEDNTGCNYSAWGTTVRNMATAAGVDLTGYDQIIHYFPRTSACGFSGVAQMPGRYSWINGSSSSTIAHELGHNFGVHHASSSNCTLNGQRVSVGGTCTLDEYGDPFDVMGRGYRHMSAYQKGRLGFLEASNTLTLSAGGTFTVVPIETKSTGVQSLRIPIPGTSEYYYVEQRIVYGFDSFRATDPVVNGVLVHRATDYSRLVRPGLVDMNPGTTTFTDAALGVGRTFTDSAANISITVNSVSTSGASVTVSLAGGGGTGGTGGTGGSAGTGGTGGGGTGGTGGSGGSGGGGGTTCPAGETAYGGHCYFTLGSSSMIYQGGVWNCALRGAHVVWIESAAENQFVANLAAGADHWIGADDLGTEGTWVWTLKNQTFWTGGLNGGPVNNAFENFTSDEPNDSGDCARITSGGGWRDVACSTPQRVICERD